MRLEYFQLIDRVIELNLADAQDHAAEATVPTTSPSSKDIFPAIR